MPEVLSFKDKLEVLKELRIAHPALVAVRNRITETIEFGPYKTKAPWTIIGGPSGVGKTTLFKWMEETYGGESSDRVTVNLPGRLPMTTIPRIYIWVTLGDNPTLDKLCTTILYLYGDPYAESGDIASKTRRIDIFAHYSGTIAWFVDECQRLVDRDGVVASDRIVDWLRARVDAASRHDLGLRDPKYIALFLFGLGRVEKVIIQDTQVERRSDAGLRLEAFARTGESWDNFEDVVITFCRSCPLPFADDIRLDSAGVTEKRVLAEIHLNFVRFHYATWGLIGRLADLLQRATIIANRPSEGKSISMEVLAKAFSELVLVREHPISIKSGNTASMRDMPNPFLPDFSFELPVPSLRNDFDLLPDTKTRRRNKQALKREAQQAFAARP